MAQNLFKFSDYSGRQVFFVFYMYFKFDDLNMLYKLYAPTAKHSVLLWSGSRNRVSNINCHMYNQPATFVSINTCQIVSPKEMWLNGSISERMQCDQWFSRFWLTHSPQVPSVHAHCPSPRQKNHLMIFYNLLAHTVKSTIRVKCPRPPTTTITKICCHLK